MVTSDGQSYLDYLSGAGALNYGHNNAHIRQALVDYLLADGIVHSLDLHTVAKAEFIQAFYQHILRPRGLNFRLQFTSPTGTSVIESAIKLARRVTGRTNVVAFTNGFHGMSGVSLSLTANRYYRQAFLAPGVTRLPYDNYLGDGYNTLSYFRQLLEDVGSGLDLPAAVIVETVQGEGGVNTASSAWLNELRELTRHFDIPLIVDDVQAGCGRTGSFFSFEHAGIVPDFVCLSKSLSGIGVPFALLLTNPQFDAWSPGEDNGTFRGNNLAFVAAKTAIENYWAKQPLEPHVLRCGAHALDALHETKRRYPELIKDVRGRGLFIGVEFYDSAVTKRVAEHCFRQKLIIETAGATDQVLKLMPPLTLTESELSEGLATIEAAVAHCAGPATVKVVASPSARGRRGLFGGVDAEG